MRHCLIFLLVLSSAFIALADNALVTYKVVASVTDPNTKVVGVAIGEEVYALEKDAMVPMLYSGRGPSGHPYRYVMLDNITTKNVTDIEPFERPAITQATETFNEVYGRAWNTLSVPQVPKFQDYAPYVTYDNCKLFEDGTIATIYLEADPVQVQAMHAGKLDKKVAVAGKLTYIAYDDIKQIDNVVLKVGGHSSRKWAKVPYKISIPETSQEGLYHRWNLKLRSETSDPSVMREKLYSDMLEASGVLSSHGGYVRVFINNTPIGLYLLVDDVASESFIRQNFHGGQDVELGSMIKGDAGKGQYAANLGYLGNTEAAYDDEVYKVEIDAPDGKPPAMNSLIDFMLFIHNYDVSGMANASIETTLKDWSPRIDVERFIRQMALEFLGGNWDGVQYSGNNYILYQLPDTDQYVMVPMDFDYTFGSGLEEDQRVLMTGSWSDFAANRKVHSYLWEKLRLIPSFVQLYEDTVEKMADIVGNPDALSKRIDALAYMLQHDVDWDRSLIRLTEGTTRPWSGATFLESLEKGTGEADEQIGLKEWIRTKHKAVKGTLDHKIVAADKENAANQLDDIAEEIALAEQNGDEERKSELMNDPFMQDGLEVRRQQQEIMAAKQVQSVAAPSQ